MVEWRLVNAAAQYLCRCCASELRSIREIFEVCKLYGYLSESPTCILYKRCMPTNTCALADQPIQMRQILMCPYIKLTPWRRRQRRQPFPKVHFQHGHRCRICALLRCKWISFHFICITRAYTQTRTHTRTTFGTSIRRGYLHSCNSKKHRKSMIHFSVLHRPVPNARVCVPIWKVEWILTHCEPG